MKRKILSLILVLMLVPLGFVLSACKDKKTYSLSNLNDEFNKIEQISDNVMLNDGVIIFNYNNYVDKSEQQYFNKQINQSGSAYSALKQYEEMLTNSMNFSRIYLQRISSSDKKVTKETKDNLFDSLNNFVENVKTVSERIDNLAEIMEFYGDNVSNITCLNALETLYKKYGQLIKSSFNFNKTLSDIYFSDILSISKIDYSTTNINDLDITKALINIQTRLDIQVVYLTETYVEMYILGDSTADKLTTKVGEIYPQLDSKFTEYTQTVNSIKNKTLNLEIKENIETNKKVEFYEKNLELYNIQSAMENDYDIFVNATNKVSHNDVVANPNSTKIQLAYADSINNYHHLVNKYNNSLKGIITLLGL